MVSQCLLCRKIAFQVLPTALLILTLFPQGRYQSTSINMSLTPICVKLTIQSRKALPNGSLHSLDVLRRDGVVDDAAAQE